MIVGVMRPAWTLLLALAMGCGARTPPPPAIPPAAPAEVGPVVAAEDAWEPDESSSRPPEGPAQPAASSVLVFVRHAEKAAGDDPPLTERGQRRADCLARLLAPLRPDHLLASPTRRTQQTLAPLARDTGLTPQLIDPSDLAGWTEALRHLPPGSRAVVSGHSNTIPAWLHALGVDLIDLDAEGNIPHDDYDRLIEVVVDERGRVLASVTFAYCTEPPSER